MPQPTDNPELGALITQGRVIRAANSGPIPPTPPREDSDGALELSEQLIRDREEERY